MSGTASTDAAGCATAVQVYLLGGFRVVVGGQPVADDAWKRKSARQLFKCLLSRPHRRMSKDDIVELLWPESEPSAAATNVRSTVYAIRDALKSSGSPNAAGTILNDRDGVSIASEQAVWVDADAFERGMAAVRHATDPLPVLRELDALYVGQYLPDDQYEDWSVERREALQRAWAEVQLRIARETGRRGDEESAIHALQRLLEADACNEPAAEALMRILATRGRRSDALRVYQQVTEALANELAIEPSDSLIALNRQIAAGDQPSAQAIDFRCTYPFPRPRQLIARDAELERLERLLTVGRTAGGVAFIGAPAGTGKSTLIGELVQRAQARGVVCLAGGCYEDRGAIPLGLFQDALADFLLAQASAQLEPQQSKALAEIARVVPELRYRLQLDDQPDIDGPVDRMRLFGAVHAWLRGVAERAPTLLVLEDLHAADEASLHLLHYLARHTRRLPLVIVGTYRTEQATAGQPLSETLVAMLRERLAEDIRVRPLTRHETGLLTSAVLEGVPSESLTTSLYMTTGGNPLFVEQLVLALAEGGELRLRGGVWDGSVDIRGAPPIVREVIAQRLARLSESCRRTLAMIAVLGQSTEHSVLLATLEPIDEAVVLNDLEESIAASVLQETPGGYGFCHVLLRDAVYWNLSQPQRIRLHSRAADAIEQMAGPRAMDRAAELAHHYVLAGQSPSYRASALRYSLEAGRRARTISANREALTHFTQAVGLFERRGAPAETGQRAEAYEGQGQAQRGLGLWSDAVASFRQVLAVAADPIQRGRAHAEIASALNHMGQTSQALAESDAGMAEISVAGGPAPTGVRSHLLALKAYVWFFEGRFEQLLHLGEEMIVAAREIGQPRLLSAAHSVRGWAYMGRGSVREALAEYQLALAAAVASEDKMDIAMGHVNLGVQSYLGARLSEARVHLETGIQMFREAAGELRIINALQHLGRVSLAEGDLELARTHADLALELATEQHDRWAADCRDLLANIHVLRTEWEAAQPYYEQALEVRREVGFKAGIVDALLGLGAVHHRRGDFATAMPRFLEAEQVVGTMDVCPQSLAVRRHLGRLHIAANDLNAARAQLDPALELLRHVSDTYEVAPTFLACAELEATCGNLELAVQHAEHAYQASRSAEHIAESSAMIGALYATTDNLTVGQSAVTAGLKMAMRLDAPRLIALNHLAAARLAVAAGDDHLAQHSFDESRRAFERARIPIELAAVERESRSRSLVLGDATQRQR